MWRTIRITVLLVALALVAAGTWLDRHRTTSWQRTVWVGAFALDADGSTVSAAELQRLRSVDLDAVAAFINSEAHRHGVAVSEPVSLRLYPAPPSLPHSVGLRRGLTGVVHLFADAEYRGENDIVIAHELLHTFGATDKYDLATGVPRFPDGYGDPDRQPRFPQQRAEIMAGRIPLDENQQVMAADFDQAVVGPLTAREIGWR